jgi:hypothetical protein
MKKITVIALLPLVLLFAFSCELFKPKAEVEIQSVTQPGDDVVIGFTIENTGTVGIAYWDVWFEVMDTSDGIKRDYASGGTLSVGGTASGTAYIYAPSADLNTVKVYKMVLEAE